MSHDLHPHHLKQVRLDELRPTQAAVGMAEVNLKRREWHQLSAHDRQQRLQSHVFPAVFGPKQQAYIVDHHHLGLALLQEGIQDIWITVLDDLSWLKKEVFWRVMEFRTWAHPYDQRGSRCNYADMPKRLTDLGDDPFRSLAAQVRDAGGFAKSQAPFAEFLWADFFRQQWSAQLTAGDVEDAVKPAIKLACSAQARYLPGWSGKA